MTTWCFTVDGAPVGKGRPRAGKRGRGPTAAVVLFTPTKTKIYEQAVALSARAWLPREKIEGPIGVMAELVLPRPAHLKIRRDVAAPVKPDIDNAAKALLDGLKAHFRDEQVTRLVLSKRYANPAEKPHARVVVFTEPPIKPETPEET